MKTKTPKRQGRTVRYLRGKDNQNTQKQQGTNHSRSTVNRQRVFTTDKPGRYFRARKNQSIQKRQKRQHKQAPESNSKQEQASKAKQSRQGKGKQSKANKKESARKEQRQSPPKTNKQKRNHTQRTQTGAAKDRPAPPPATQGRNRPPAHLRPVDTAAWTARHAVVKRAEIDLIKRF